jgi:hypothetical protein
LKSETKFITESQIFCFILGASQPKGISICHAEAKVGKGTANISVTIQWNIFISHK